jgi:hypothetical protein
MDDVETAYWRLVEEIFHEALAVPETGRKAFVVERGGGNAGMEREVRGILAGYETQDRITGGTGRESAG